MKKIILAAATASLLSGCAYFGARAHDFGDIVRLEGSIGVGLQANVNAGELLHLGLGSSRRKSAGWAYGLSTSERRVEDHFPLSYVSTLINPDVAALHSLKIGDGPELPQHRCPTLAPGAFAAGTIRKSAMQFWNLEAGVMLIGVGVEAGVNPAELVDFILGIFGLDIACDDEPEGRARRRLWIPEGPQLLSEK